ncbi:Tol-Pal system beta propeller repeat protein TolB [Paludibacterium purpuratum]|uniref:Tol-Pal system protein TolB n=1 Tax=Paludibacterium purpuratum TaxID=1144873 RepID=A0A4R7B6T8_9NEIS|nr:Tol-Pal system beta propeller repeat protein TolB [Paludibacterium purpuratum]TDR80378.1 TolB protein [Paludibacterium purpuratum]
MLSLKPLLRTIFVVVSLASSLARADMTIEIVGGGSTRHAIAVVPFKDESTRLRDPLTLVVRNDLNLSGMFRVLDTSNVSDVPHTSAAIQYPLWQGAGAQSVAVGTVSDAGNGQVTVSFSLMDVSQKKQLTAGQFTVGPDQGRQVGHKIADMIYRAITGQPGIFSTRIVYVLKQGNANYQLQVADIDGGRAQTVLRSKEPIMSPAWSPDGRYLAYVSFETHKPVVWVQDLATGQRRAAANFKGSNSAPAWSPDGRQLAVVLTTSGNSEIYLVDAAGGGAPRRLTRSDAIDTEPSWSADGAKIVFVSDRAGGPQIYSMAATGGDATRLTWQGSYNVSPRLSPDGNTLTFIQRQAGAFRVMMQDRASGDVRVLSSDPYNERPSFAPNGQMVLYASVQGGQSVLYAATLDGGNKARLAVLNGEVQDPAWGPFTH